MTTDFPTVWLRSAKAIDKSSFPVMGLDSFPITILCFYLQRIVDYLEDGIFYYFFLFLRKVYSNVILFTRATLKFYFLDF